MTDTQVVPLAELPSQSLRVTLGGQACRIDVFTRNLRVATSPPGAIPTDPPVFEEVNPIFLDLYVLDALVIGGVLCLNRTRIVRDAYLGFLGDLAFVDASGAGEDPSLTGLGTRFLLTYWPDLA